MSHKPRSYQYLVFSTYDGTDFTECGSFSVYEKYGVPEPLEVQGDKALTFFFPIEDEPVLLSPKAQLQEETGPFPGVYGPGCRTLWAVYI